MPLNWTTFQQDCNEITVMDAVGSLGGLYRWLLTPSALKVAEEFQGLGSIPRPALPNHAGGCWVMFVNSDDDIYALLRRAYVLPLEWKPAVSAEAPHDQRLPASIRNVADDVLRTLGDETKNGQHWRLHLVDDADQAAPNLNGTDLDKSLKALSGWVSIAGGLWSAMKNTATEPTVWATGCWDSQLGVTEVGDETLNEKMALAAEFGANTVFLPASQAAKFGVSDVPPGAKLKLMALPRTEPKWQKALGSYLGALKAPPPPDADPKTVQVPHYRELLKLESNVERADAFYRERLLSPIAERCRKHLDTQPGRPDLFPSILVTIVSGNHGLVRLGIETPRATHCLAFHTRGKMADIAKQIKAENDAFNDARGIKCKLMPKLVDDEPVQMLRGFREHVDQFIRETVGEGNPGAVAFDTTPGTGLKTLAWQYVATPRNWLLYLRHDWDAEIRRPDPFTESYLMWRAGDSWEHHVGVGGP